MSVKLVPKPLNDTMKQERRFLVTTQVHYSIQTFSGHELNV